MEKVSHLERLSDELYVAILSYLDQKQLVTASGTSQRFYRITGELLPEGLRCLSRFAASQILLLGEKTGQTCLGKCEPLIAHSSEKNLLATRIAYYGCIQFYRINDLKKNMYLASDPYGYSDSSPFFFHNECLTYCINKSFRILKCDQNFCIKSEPDAGMASQKAFLFSSPNEDGCLAIYDSDKSSITLFDRKGLLLQTFRQRERCIGLQLKKTFLVALYGHSKSYFILSDIKDPMVTKKIDDPQYGGFFWISVWDCSEDTLCFITFNVLIIQNIFSETRQSITIPHDRYRTIRLYQDQVILASDTMIYLYKCSQMNDEEIEPVAQMSTIPRKTVDGSPYKKRLLNEINIAITCDMIAIANENCPFIELYDLRSGKLLTHFSTAPAYPRNILFKKQGEDYLLIAGLSSGQTAVWYPGSLPDDDAPRSWWQKLKERCFPNPWTDIQARIH